MIKLQKTDSPSKVENEIRNGIDEIIQNASGKEQYLKVEFDFSEYLVDRTSSQYTWKKILREIKDDYKKIGIDLVPSINFDTRTILVLI